MMLDFLELADGCSGCDGCGTPGPISAAFAGLLSLLWGGLAAFLLIDHARLVYSLPGVDGGSPTKHVHWYGPVLACAGGAGAAALLGLLVMVWATVLLVLRRGTAVVPTILGALGVLLATVMAVIGFSLDLPVF